MIEVQALRKRFGRRSVLEGVSFQVKAGEIVALAGSNGAGKTTTLGITMGFLEPSAGSVRVLGVDPLRRSHLGAIGWMPESPAFPRCFDVGSLIAFQAATVPSWDPGLATELIERLEIDLTQSVQKLSRGQTARLALLCALAHRPRLLILDDPTLGLDPKGRRLLLGELLTLAGDSGSAVLISTHLLSEADWSLDRMLLLRRGVIEVDEEVDHLKARCRRLFLPPDAPPPRDLGVMESREGPLLTAFNTEDWARFQAEVPTARCERVTLDDIYVVFTEGEN